MKTRNLQTGKIETFKSKNIDKNNTKKEYNPYSFLVGGVAEKLIEQLFLSLDYDVFPFGMENTVPEMKTRLKRNNSKVSSQIRNMPDFVVMKEKEDPVFIEVKYRANGQFEYKDLVKKYVEYPYKGVLVVLVSNKHIKAEFAEELEYNPLTPTSKNYLGNALDFTKDEKDKIRKFCNYAQHFFDGVADL